MQQESLFVIPKEDAAVAASSALQLDKATQQQVIKLMAEAIGAVHAGSTEEVADAR